MRKLFTAAFILGLSTSVFGQQDPQFSQNMFNRLFSNPAYAGSSDAICFTGLFRSQWVSYDGAPKTGVFSADMPINKINMGAGLTLWTDEIGFENTFEAKLALSYRFKIGSTSHLGVGLDLGYMQKSLDGTKLVPNQQNDPIIPGNVSGNAIPDIGAGLYFNSSKFYAGVSATHLTENEIDLDKTNYKLARHYYLTAGYLFELTPSLGLTPSVYLKNDGKTTQTDINLLLHVDRKSTRLNSSHRT